MKDITKALELDGAKLPIIHGHTRIELTNVKSGGKKIIEHDNTFQSNILSAALRSLGESKSNPWSNNDWAARPLWRNLCGGILLFRDAIDNSGGDVEYMPASNLMVANGSYGVSNSSTPTELGSYNSIESSTGGASSITFVYDWDTSHSNGTIGCICLTSEQGGYIGYGNASGGNASLMDLLTVQSAPSANSAHGYYNGKKYFCTEINYTAKTVTFKKGVDGITKETIFSGQDWETFTVSYSGSLAGSGTTNSYALQVSEEEIGLFKSSTADSISNGSSGGVLVYNMKTNTATVTTIQNTSGYDVYVYNRGVGFLKDSAGNFYFPTRSNRVAKFNSSGVFVQLYTNIGNGDTLLPVKFTDDILGFAYGSSNPIKLIYGNNALPTNGKSANYDKIIYSKSIDAMCAVNAGQMAQAMLRPFHNPMYLSTINNLDTAVTKDNTQTMKVIYTLTEV